MGQCSTLPTEGRSANAKHGDSVTLRGDEAMAHRQKDRYSQRSHTGKRHAQSHAGRNSQIHSDNGYTQSRNPETHQSDNAEPMEEDNGRDGIPQPPDIATRTRCYKLNLDSDINAQGVSFLGPFADSPPPLTYSDSDDSSVEISPTQIAIQTAKIFRGITVGKDGTILSQNARATRSNRGAKNKRGEKSRQATKIEKAKDLVEETIQTGKAPDSDEAANMMSLVTMGEYDDMKYLVRDGARKLREASDLPDDSLLTVNRSREGTLEPANSSPSERNRASPNYVVSQRAASVHTSNKTRPLGLPQSVPPKLKGHPRDRPSSRRLDDKSRVRDYHDEADRGRNTNVDGDWSHALSFSKGFHSIWNCVGTGADTGTISPTQVVSPRDGKAHSMGVSATPYRPVYEGRDSNFGQTREGGVATRAN